MQRIAMVARPSFSLVKGSLHGLAVIAVFMLVGLAFAATGAFGDRSDKTAEIAGQQLVVAFLLAIVASYGFQTGKKVLGGVMLGLVALLLAYQVFFFSRVARDVADATPMTAAEKKYPESGEDNPRLCQAALGFSFPHPPGAFAFSDSGRLDPAHEPRLSANVSRWVWTDLGKGERIVVRAIKGVGRTEGGFRAFTAGVKQGLEEDGGASMTGDRWLWTDGRGEFNVSGRFPNGTSLQMRCLSRGPAGSRSPLTVCIQTFTGAESDLQEVETGLELAPCSV
ncbi:MAG: hypothetical protein ACJ76N_20045 [Thermoanaerobaculia bacterium]